MQGKYNFITLHEITLRRFSLYNKKGRTSDITETISKGVYCLAGANGLGKTTYLNAINYGLTGLVLEPNKDVYTPDDIVPSNKRYTEKYFSGRISAKDEKEAEIEILFKVKEKYFRIIRGFFHRDELKLLEVFSLDQKKKIFHFNNSKQDPKELDRLYQNLLTTETGFDKFEHFVFYQLYVLTFDENRRMIFWDDRASRNAMAIAFNSNPEDVNKIAELTRSIETHDSKGRNARYQATLAKNKLKELTQKIHNRKPKDFDKLEIEYEKLHKELEKIERQFADTKIERDTLLKKQSHLNFEIMQLKIEHSKLFSRYSKPRSKLLENINIQLAIKKQECCLCDSSGSQVVDSINRTIHQENCPLCNTKINESDNLEQNKLLKLIKSNDDKIFSKTAELDNVILAVEGKQNDLEKIEIERDNTRVKIEEFAEDNPDLSFKETGGQKRDTLIQQYRNQYIHYENESKEEYLKRDKLKPEYEKYLKKIEAVYKEAEIVFVPIFKKLAKSFIGLNLNIHSRRTEKTIKLVLELDETARTQSFQLSESQRFFLDIALRMSLAIFLSQEKNGATMLIDTPEGSLDIAYESRVGNMFAEFVIDYNQNLFITANINASQLLVALAEKCGKTNMKFRRMLDWTDLSIIQKDGEELFKKVYRNIETALNKKK